MDNDAARRREDDQTRAMHEQAVAAGEKRLLTRTMDGGRLHSYPADEIGFSPGRGQVQVRSWWGMGILTAVMGLLVVISVVILLGPVGRNELPFWGALFLTALGGFGAWYTFGMARSEYRAKKLRKERRVPEPGAGHVSQ